MFLCCRRRSPLCSCGISNSRRCRVQQKSWKKTWVSRSLRTDFLTEIDPDDHNHAFGLCGLGLGMPEIGWVSLNDLASVRGGLGLPVERDLLFRAEKRLNAYARDARLAGQIGV
ncbi:DUF2958 domain-containing protein [Ottowia testudinis]|uniref:DUF2958 domain-containing protein n=1 Tax=Ottowia testudinis TaxID=2816950 RepID=A0A975CIM9_9BURK|nr:DUF2958 domain-containing protein [Ottowia testudinis]QTD44098.1 DUF2958 domain-containing protein [Ottowia testudinis]